MKVGKNGALSSGYSVDSGKCCVLSMLEWLTYFICITENLKRYKHQYFPHGIPGI